LELAGCNKTHYLQIHFKLPHHLKGLIFVYMANLLRKKTQTPPSPEELNPDKEVQVTVTEVVKDERTTKIVGASSLLFSLFLFIALTSYLFTWQEDQDKVQTFGIKIFATQDIVVHNLLGVLGAYVAHLFVYNGFGLASYLFCTFFFVLGVNLLFGKKIFSLIRNIRYVLVGLVVLSIFFAFAAHKSEFSWGGAVGEMISDWFVKWIGNFGTGAMLATAVFSYVIWRFNPSFKWPEFKKKEKEATPIEEEEHENDYFEPTNKAVSEEEIPLILNINETDQEPSLPLSNNKLKEGATGVAVVMPKKEPITNDPLIAFDIIERQEEPIQECKLFIDDSQLQQLRENPEIQTVHDLAKAALVIQGNGGMELEIKQSVEEEIAQQPVLEERNYIKEEATEEERIDEENEEVEEGEEDVEEDVEPPFTFNAPIIPKQSLDTKYDTTLELSGYRYPTLDILETHGSEKIIHDPAELEAHKNQIVSTLMNYDIAIQRIAATVGPTVTLYEIVPAAGVRISRIKNLEDDIALSLAALGIRIIAPIPGKGTIGIEVPNIKKTVVSMKTLLMSEKFANSTFSLPIAIGKKIDNENFIVDLATMPHLLMAGATGQGKSVGINTLLVSLLFKKHPSQLKFVLVDPKKVELSLYRVIEKHFLAKLPGEEESIITDTKKVVHTLNALCIEMDNRYDLLKEAGCRNIKEYNEKFTNRKLNPQKGHQFLPFIVLVVDEFADLIMTAGKEVEMPIARLAQLARAIGIHLIIATQRPSVNIITGTIKANFPARIAFKVSSKIDSRTILDAGGAEQLIGKGDMLISYNGEITRLQCAFVDTPEVERVCDFIGDQLGYPEAFLLPEYVDEKEMESKDFDDGDKDPLFADAARLIVQNQMGSTSLIQRRMKLGYNRAGRLMDQLERAGIVGQNLGSKAREVLFKSDTELEEYLNNLNL